VVIGALFIWKNHEIPVKLHKDIRNHKCNKVMSESICKYPHINTISSRQHRGVLFIYMYGAIMLSNYSWCRGFPYGIYINNNYTTIHIR
jgi:hypothetical protein